MADMQQPQRRPPRRTAVVSARLDLDSDAGRIYENLLSEGWKKQEIVEQALLAAAGNLPKKDSMDERTIIQLTNAIQRLEALVERMMTGNPITPQQEEQIRHELDPVFVQSARRLARPAFRPGR